MTATTYLKDAIDFDSIERVLVVKLQHLGDVLLTTPVFGALKQRYPHLQLDALIYSDSRALLENNPHIRQIFTIDRNWKQHAATQVQHEWHLFNQLKQSDYQLTINLTDRLRAAWLSRLLQPQYSVAATYGHKRGSFWRNSFSHVYPTPTGPRHTVELHLDALRRLGFYPQAHEKALHLTISAAAAQTIADLLQQANMTNRPLVVIHPTSRWMFKAWNPQGFAEVIGQLNERGAATVLVSGPDAKELAYVQQIRELGGNAQLDLAGRLSLQELAALLQQAHVFVGLDSVAMHMAAALSTPCVALFGPSNDRQWGPWQVDHRIISGAQFHCRPCGLDGCGGGKISECLQAITPPQVLRAIEELMS